MVQIHKLHGAYPTGYNLINNGGFTQYADRWIIIDNTSPDRHSKDIVDTEYYRTGTIGFGSTQEGKLGFWTFSGATAGIAVAPRREDGTAVTALDGGNILKMSFTSDGTLFLDQEFIDLKRFDDTVISLSCSGTNFHGLAVVTLQLLVNGEEIDLVTAAAASFGPYRRFGGFAQLPEKVESLTFRIAIKGCIGEAIGISGVFGALGQQTNSLPFSSSFLDRAVPSGVVYMIAGESCPVGYAEYGTDDSLALISGTKAYQSIENQDVRMAGQEKHDHTDDFIDSLRLPSDAFVETFIPVPITETSLVLAIPFGDYPSQIGFPPYPGEAPQTVLGELHSHRLRTEMPHLPPTFPIKFCIKL